MTGDSKLIDRFRAPVRFKRNPRYLPAEAQNHPTLEARPREIHLEPGERMKERLNLINTAPVTCSLQLDTSQMKYFRIGNGRYPQKGSNLIAPGLSCSLLVKLIVSNLQDEVCETLQIFYRPGIEPLRVRLFAKRKEAYITFPRVVDMGPCLVNSTISKLFPLNLSSKRSTHINLRSDFNSVFNILPKEFEILQEMPTEVQVKFRPPVSGEFKTIFQVESGNQCVGEIVCYGYGEDLQVDLVEETNDENTWLLGKELHNDGCITGYCQLPNVYPGFRLERQLKLRNDGNVTLSMHLDKEDGAPEDLPSDFRISFGELILLPKSFIRLNVTFCSERLGKHDTTLTIRAAQIQCEEIFEVLKLRASTTVTASVITLSPEAITLPDPVILTETARIEVKMSNPSATCPVGFCWTLPRSDEEDSNISFCPESGLLLALETRTVNISITPKGLGQMQYLLPCKLTERAETTVLLRISCEVISPSVELKTDLLDFGVVCPDQSLTKETCLRNSSSTSLTWSTNCPQERDSPFSIRPSRGTIKPKQKQPIWVKFHPQSADYFQEEVEFRVEGTPLPPRTLSLIGEAQIANVTMEPQEIQIDKLYVTIPRSFDIKLRNPSPVPAKFCWLTENIRDCVLPCTIDGISDPLEFKISAAVLGLSCRISTPPNGTTMKNNEIFEGSRSVHLNHQIFEADGPAIEFTPMGLWMPRKVYVTVENTSAVPAIFTCKLDHFQSQEQVPLNIEIVQREDTQTQSAKAYEFCKQLLKTKRAFTISVYPSSSSINLLAHDTITIRLIGYAEIFGEFHDTLTISVLPLKKYEAEPRALIARLPVIARAYGSPVNFLMATKSMNKEDFNECLNAVVMDAKLSELLLSSIVACEWTATLGFISSITGKREQEVKLRNNSSFTVRIDWHLYCYESRGDNGLLDLCTAVNDQTHFTEEAKLSISLPLRPQGSYAVSRSYATAGRLIEPMGIKESGITLFPLQTIIPPHREASTFVSIDGRIAGSQKETKIEAYAQGFISIEKEEDNVRLLEPLFLPHLRLNLKATVTQPAVILEYGDELGVPVRLPPCPAECTPKSFQIILRAEDFILSTSLFSSIQQKSSGRQEDEDQLLILEYNKSPGVPQHLADRIWCFRRLAVRNLSPYPVAIQAEASEGEFFFKEDVQLKAQHHSHVIEIPNSPQTKEQLHSKKWLKVAANDTQYILLGCLVTRARLSKASTSTVQTRFGKLSCALRCSEQAETVLASTEIQIVIEKRLKLPEIALISPMLVDFPDTAVKQSSTIDVKIANLGVSGTIWVVEPPNAITGKKPKLEGLRVFSTTPTSGFLAATADPFRQDCARLSVKFTPRMAGEYTEELVILDALTKRTVSVHLRGRGYLQRLPN